MREAKKAGTPEDQWPDVPDRSSPGRVKVAGRVMQHRVMGNLIFMSLRDDTGDLQVAVSARRRSASRPSASLRRRTYSDLVVAVRGALGKTNTGELTVWAQAEPRRR